MKVQYFGDVNDYRKFALLRALVGEGGFKIGVCWMLTEPDSMPHGGQRGYLGQPNRWRDYDPELFVVLASAPAAPTLADLQRIEQQGLITSATFFEATTPDYIVGREKFHRDCMAALAGTELVFFDPDNGLEIPSCPKGRKRSSKFVFIDELANHYRAGRSLLIYQHFARHMPRAELILHPSDRLRACAADASIWTFESAHAVFLLAARPEHTARVEKVVGAMDAHGWTPSFFRTIHQPELADSAEPTPAK